RSRQAAALDAKGVGQPRPQALEGQLAVAGLRTIVRRHHPDHRAEALEEAGPLTGPERRGLSDVEAHLGTGVGGVGVLPAGAARGAEAPLQLAERDAAAPRHPQLVAHERTVAEDSALLAAYLLVESGEGAAMPERDTGERALGQVLGAAVALFALGAGAIHLQAAGEHRPHQLEVAFFVVVACLQVGWAAAVVTRPGRRILLVGVAGNAAVVGIWVLSRNIGLPLVQGATKPEA